MSSFELPVPVPKVGPSRRTASRLAAACAFAIVALVGWNVHHMSVSEPLNVRHVQLSPQSTFAGTTTTGEGGGG